MNKKILLFGLVLVCLASFVSADTTSLNSTGGLNYSINSIQYLNTVEYSTTSAVTGFVTYNSPGNSIFSANDSYIDSIYWEYKWKSGYTYCGRAIFHYLDGTSYTTNQECAFGVTIYTPIIRSNPNINKKVSTIEFQSSISAFSSGARFAKNFNYTKNSYVDGISFNSIFNFKTINITSDGCNINVSDDGVTYNPLNATDQYTFSGFTDTVYVILDNSSNCSYINIQAEDYAEYYKVLNLIDEATNEPFNISNTNSTKAILTCSDIGSFSYDITNNNENLSANCPYDKITVSVTYDDTAYSRTILEDFGVSDEPVYLIDLTTTQAIYNAFLVNDYVGEYTNPRIYIKKSISGETVVIHSDYLDVENKVSVYLIENDPYTLELWSDNLPVNVLGFYGADIAGTKEITVTSANIDTSAPADLGNGVTIYTYAINESGGTFAYVVFNDTTDDTTSITWGLWFLNETAQNLTLLYNVSTSGTFGEAVFSAYNITNQTNNTIVSSITYIKDGLQYTYYKQITSAPSEINADNMFGYYSAAVLQWAVIIFLSVIALSGTVTTQNYVNYIIIGGAAMAMIFGLFSISIILLMLALVIAFMFQIKSSDDTKIAR